MIGLNKVTIPFSSPVSPRLWPLFIPALCLALRHVHLRATRLPGEAFFGLVAIARGPSLQRGAARGDGVAGGVHSAMVVDEGRVSREAAGVVRGALSAFDSWTDSTPGCLY